MSLETSSEVIPAKPSWAIVRINHQGGGFTRVNK
jgi:hypothetical protein